MTNPPPCYNTLRVLCLQVDDGFKPDWKRARAACLNAEAACTFLSSATELLGRAASSQQWGMQELLDLGRDGRQRVWNMLEQIMVGEMLGSESTMRRV